MQHYEYKLVPAPEKSGKHKGLKGAALFAATLEKVINPLAAQGWQYLRSDILPEETRTGLMSRGTVYRTLMVFQRPLPDTAKSQPVVAAPARPSLRTGDRATTPPSLANLLPDTAPAPDGAADTSAKL